ncbi:MAG: hypothetical protein PHT44_01090 [Candidatus Portnoybacteria bacterium]|nr:hypothetical protein [Candidatus Portnoybacteria bacterium]MDD4982799.1 hypothetical protein [Candidatus Portnoybacteria bacterium]
MAEKAVLRDYDKCPNCGALVSRGDSDEYGFCHGGHEICGIYLRVPSRTSGEKATIIMASGEYGKMAPVTWRHFNEAELAVKKFFEKNFTAR